MNIFLPIFQAKSSFSLSTIQSTYHYLLGSARSNASVDGFLLVHFLKSPRGVPGVKGVTGVLDPAGVPGAEPESPEKFLKLEEVLLRIVILLVTMVLSSATIGGDRVAENESYLRSLPSPVSGAGPASVSSQSL